MCHLAIISARLKGGTMEHFIARLAILLVLAGLLGIIIFVARYPARRRHRELYRHGWRKR